MTIRYDGKVAIVTGAGGGLGRSHAIELAKRGAKVVVNDLGGSVSGEGQNSDVALAVVAEIEALGGEAMAHPANVAVMEQVEDMVSQTMSAWGRVDILVNNAGILRDGLLVKVKDGEIDKRMTLAEWQAVIDVNLTGVFLCGREAATRMIQKGTPGCIINISSISKAGNMGQTNYSAAKAGVAAMATVWAKELARYGIRAAAIAPGFIATEMVASMKPEALEKMAAGIPLKRLGQPEEVAHTVRYILENDYLSGRVIELDAGLRI